MTDWEELVPQYLRRGDGLPARVSLTPAGVTLFRNIRRLSAVCLLRLVGERYSRQRQPKFWFPP